jgi:heptosyltransferase II
VIAYSNILVIQTAFIGDAILASSLLEKLHGKFPSAAISILVREGNQSIYAGHPFLKEVMVWNKKERKLKNLFGLVRAIRKRKFDCVVTGHRYASSGFLTAFSGARHTAGFKENPFSFLFSHTARHAIGDGRHETERLNSLVSDFAGEAAALPRLYPTISDEKAISEYLRTPFVCMAPASVWFTKQLPAEKWIELMNRIDRSTAIYLLGAPGDTALCEELRAGSLHTGVTVLSGKLSLLQSAALMRHAAMNYVNDSAPLHLASSVNAPVTTFFCSTVPAFGFGPLSTYSVISGVDGLPCRPCGLHGYKACPLGHFKCGRLMPLPEIL